MATLSEYKAKGGVSLKRGTVSRSLGGTPVASTRAFEDKGGIIEQFTKKVGDVAGQTARMAGSVTSSAAKFAVNTPKYIMEDITPFLSGVAKTVTGELGKDLTNINRLQDELNSRTETLSEQYRSGDMSKENYQRALRDISKEYSELSQRSKTIASHADRGDVVESAAMTAATILTFGRFETRAVGTRQAAQAGNREAIQVLVRESATNLEKQVMRIPAVKQLVERNLVSGAKRLASETTAQFVRREAMHLAANALIKRPIFYQSNIADAKRVYEGILTGDYPKSLRSSAWLGVQLLEGGPIGAFLKSTTWAKGKLGELAHGRQSFIDELSKRIGDGNSSQIARFLTTTQEKAPKEFRNIERAFRIFQESNLRVTSDDVPTAVTNFLRTYTDAGIDLTTVTPSQIYKDMNNWKQADDLWDLAAKAGQLTMSSEEAARFTPVRWDASTRDAVATIVRSAGDSPQAQLEAVEQLANQPGAGFSNNSSLMLLIRRAVGESQSAEDAARIIQGIDAAAITPKYIPKKLSNQLAKLGYTMAEPVGGRTVGRLELEDTRKLVSAAAKGDELFDEAVAPNPQVSHLASFFERTGVSPSESSQYATRALGRSVAANLDKTTAASHFGLSTTTDNARGGQAILSRLQQYVENKPAARVFGRISAGKSAVVDIRQLTTREIQEALGSVENGKLAKLGRQEAKEIYRAILKGYADVPLELRGLGDRAVDTLFRVNPAQRYYSRIQSALRYTYNPFFRLQEMSETAILSRAQANNLIWNKSRGQLDEAVKILDDNRIFSGVLPGEAASDMVLGRITANLTKTQKRDLAGLALDISESRGIPLEQLVRDFPDEVDDILRVVVQYPRKGLLASPLARTLNLIFFPIRYNTKVSLLAANVLAKQPPSVQKAVIHSGFKMKEWLKSDEGIRWQSTHADAIQLFKWITPVNSIESTYKLLTGNVNGWGDMGVLGGLPLGFITQILDGQGIIDLNKPYVDPKTGNVFPDYIPQTTKARAATALGDILNSMFTYPGRIMGLPGKEATVRTLVKKIIETEGKDFEKRLNEDDLTPLNQAWIRVLKGDTSEEALDALYTSPAEGEFNGYTLPPLEIPIRPAVEARPLPKRRKNLPKKSSKSRGRKPKKTALPMPVQ